MPEGSVRSSFDTAQRWRGVVSRSLAIPARLTPALRKLTFSPEEKRRLVSVDALRAVAILGMLLVDSHGLYGDYPVQLSHVDWEGLRFADTVFPLFLFLVGVSMALSFGRKRDLPPLKVWPKFASRVIALLTLGLVLNYYKYGVPLRYMGVLQRIALASLLAVPLARRKPAWAVLGAAAMLALHTWILLEARAPGVIPGSFGAEDSIAYWIDAHLLGVDHLYRGSRFDPEGLLGVISSAGQVMLGIAAGRWLLDRPRSPRALLWLTLAGCATLLLGLAISPSIPIVKNLSTASFVLVTSGIAALALTLLYLAADVLRGERLLAPLAPPGRNALVVYAGSISLMAWMKATELTVAGAEPLTWHAYFSGVAVTAFGESHGSLVYACAHIALWYLVAAVLDKARIYVRV